MLVAWPFVPVVVISCNGCLLTTASRVKSRERSCSNIA